MSATLDFQSGRYYIFLIYMSPRCLLPGFESIGPGVQEEWTFKVIVDAA